MSRDKQGSKAGRRERHLAREAQMRERKRLRKARAARFAHLPGQQVTPDVSLMPSVALGVPWSASRSRATPGPALAAIREAEAATLGLLTVPALREVATDRGIEFRSKDRKADLIAKIVAES